ncbi:acyl carrier protein [Actinokineospora iranica]|uniref:Phosphopantetheine attachment site n=1 Tax=Actinokineospora iranica TaxID=1271860 RepID=A0A1G6Z256_9PSEU|nr:phosphopantetheine-binding protein [Actinokineospora iranica]SDD96698.1 Phosphopantetheine attachment site [Actinokineospora iranica]
MTETEFIDLVGAESGLPLTVADLATGFDDLPGWDSVHLLKVLSALETERGITLRVAELLSTKSLGDLHRAVAAA